MRTAIDYIGMTFGKLTVVKRVPSEGKRDTNWLCLCQCGNFVNVLAGNLKRTNSCGCLIKENRKHKDIIGIRYGMLVVVEELQKQIGNYRMVKCRCDCGNFIEKRLSSLFYISDRSGASCGCLRGVAIRRRNESKNDYGLRKHPLYGVWKAMKSRCYNKNDPSYKNYGGRGHICL